MIFGPESPTIWVLGPLGLWDLVVKCRVRGWSQVYRGFHIASLLGPPKCGLHPKLLSLNPKSLNPLTNSLCQSRLVSGRGWGVAGGMVSWVSAGNGSSQKRRETLSASPPNLHHCNLTSPIPYFLTSLECSCSREYALMVHEPRMMNLFNKCPDISLYNPV